MFDIKKRLMYLDEDNTLCKSASEAARSTLERKLKSRTDGYPQGVMSYILAHPEEIRDLLNDYFETLEEFPDTDATPAAGMHPDLEWLASLPSKRFHPQVKQPECFLSRGAGDVITWVYGEKNKIPGLEYFTYDEIKQARITLGRQNTEDWS